MKGRRHTSGGQARHPDDWLMTYADTITLLLCLFVVLLALHGAKPHGAVAVGLPPSADTPSSSTLLQTAIVVAPFRELAGIPRPPEDADDDTADRATRQDNLSTRRAVVATALSSGVPALMPTAHSVPKAARVLAASPAEAHRPSTALPPPEAEKPANASAKAAADLKGDRITIFQFSSTAFFASGAAHLSDSGQSILESLLDRLQSPEFAAYHITVEGHTDDEPISSPQFPSNWELSAARAAAVVRFFVEHGISAQRLRAAGYADTFPLVPNRDAAANPIPENQAKNRRVVIELEKVDRAATQQGHYSIGIRPKSRLA